jgi:hypothetical protein
MPPVAPEYRPRSQLNWLSKGGPFPRPASSPGAKRARPHFKLDRAPHPVRFKTRPSRPVRFETAPVASGAGRCGHGHISNSRPVWFETGPEPTTDRTKTYDPPAAVGVQNFLTPDASAMVPGMKLWTLEGRNLAESTKTRKRDIVTSLFTPLSDLSEVPPKIGPFLLYGG